MTMSLQRTENKKSEFKQVLKLKDKERIKEIHNELSEIWNINLNFPLYYEYGRNMN